ncbi:YHS domain-containing (seleno)protein [Geojedonia litorea]|uniref:YHS domain-containing (Seleno)protein n=1 Tax=Geojedonia litorea TaxID=1268269 RepID=A0ABV9N761_9FLAO
MKQITLFLLFFLYQSAFTQSVDYNTKNGFAAEGYDVVAYYDNNAIEGNKLYSSSYDGVNYKFVSQQNLDTFNSNPIKYIPQYGGYCAYAMAQNGKKVGVNPKTFEIRNGKLYLFYNAWGTNTLKLWLKNNVKGLQQKADQYWEAVKHK